MVGPRRSGNYLGSSEKLERDTRLQGFVSILLLKRAYVCAATRVNFSDPSALSLRELGMEQRSWELVGFSGRLFIYLIENAAYAE